LLRASRPLLKKVTYIRARILQATQGNTSKGH
jgi:hypothetical protein